MSSSDARKASPSIPARPRATRCSVPASMSGPAAATSSRRRRGILSGRAYAWSVDHHPADIPIAEAPAWLVEALTAGKRPGSVARRDAAQWAIEKAGLVTEYRDMAVASVAGKLLRAVSLDPAFVATLVHDWNACHAPRRCPSAPSPRSSTASPTVKSPGWRTAMRDADASPTPPTGSARPAARTEASGIPTDLKPDDFYAYMLEHKYIFAPTGEIWPASSVDARLPVDRRISRPRPGSTRTARSSR